MNYDWSKPMVIDWTAPMFTKEDIENCVIKRVLNNTYCAPFCEREYIRQIPWWNPHDPFGTGVAKNVGSEGGSFIPGLQQLPAYPQVSALTVDQHMQAVRILSSYYKNVQPHLYAEATEADNLILQEIKELYESEQKQFLKWARLVWLNGDCIGALRPKPLTEQVYDAEFKMRAHQLKSWPQKYALAAQIPLTRNEHSFQLDYQAHLLNVNVQDLPIADYPEVMVKPLCLLKSCPMPPEPGQDHNCKFVLPYEESVSSLPMSEIHRELAHFANSHECRLIASESALQCLLETDRTWHIPVSVISTLNTEAGDTRSTVVLGDEFAIQKACATYRTYSAYKHLLKEAFAPSGAAQHDPNLTDAEDKPTKYFRSNAVENESETNSSASEETTRSALEPSKENAGVHTSIQFSEGDDEVSSDSDRLVIAERNTSNNRPESKPGKINLSDLFGDDSNSGEASHDRIDDAGEENGRERASQQLEMPASNEADAEGTDSVVDSSDGGVAEGAAADQRRLSFGDNVDEFSSIRNGSLEGSFNDESRSNSNISSASEYSSSASGSDTEEGVLGFRDNCAVAIRRPRFSSMYSGNDPRFRGNPNETDSIKPNYSEAMKLIKNIIATQEEDRASSSTSDDSDSGSIAAHEQHINKEEVARRTSGSSSTSVEAGLPHNPHDNSDAWDSESGDQMSERTREYLRGSSPSELSSDAESDPESDPEVNSFHLTKSNDNASDDSDTDSSLAMDNTQPEATEVKQAVESDVAEMSSDNTRDVERAIDTPQPESDHSTGKTSAELEPPARSYQKWHLADANSNTLPFIVHLSHECRKGENEVLLEPIVEFQPELGGTKQSTGKIRALSLALMLRPAARLVNVRVNHKDGNVMVIDEMGRDEFTERHGEQRSHVADALHTALDRLRYLRPGQYLLAHQAKYGANAMLYSSKGLSSGQETGHGGETLCLRPECIDMTDAEEAIFAKTPPDLAPILLPYHKCRGILPLAFSPHEYHVTAPRNIRAALARLERTQHATKSNGGSHGGRGGGSGGGSSGGSGGGAMNAASTSERPTKRRGKRRLE